MKIIRKTTSRSTDHECRCPKGERSPLEPLIIKKSRLRARFFILVDVGVSDGICSKWVMRMSGMDAFSPRSLLTGIVCVFVFVFCLLLAGVLPVNIPGMYIQRYFQSGNALNSIFKAVTIAFVIWVVISTLGPLTIDKAYDEFHGPLYPTLRLVVYCMWFMFFFLAPFIPRIGGVSLPFTWGVVEQIAISVGIFTALFRRYVEDVAMFLIASTLYTGVVFYAYEAFFLGFYLSVNGSLPDRQMHDANVLTFILWCAIFSLGLRACFESPSDDSAQTKFN